MIEKLYEDELRYLVESGREFAKAHPDRAGYLNIDSVGDRDPHVERLFEGFAFLTARIREKLDDAFPQLTEGLITMLWPQYLQEIPSMTLVQFEARIGFLQESRTLPARSEIVSTAAGPENAICKFSTIHPVVINPMALQRVQRHSDALNNEVVSFDFSLDSNIPWSKYNFKQIRLYLHAELPVANLLHKALTTSVIKSEVELGMGGHCFQLNPQSVITPGGLSAQESILPTSRSTFFGYNLLKEYFAYPEKFLCFDINGLDSLPPPESTPQTVTLKLTIQESFPHHVPLNENTFRLYCSPAVNLFEQAAEPINRDGTRSEFIVQADQFYRKSVSLHSITTVTGIDKASGETTLYTNYHTFKHIGVDEQKTYTSRIGPTAAGKNELFIQFGGTQLSQAQVRQESVVVEGWCSNGVIPREYIDEGDLKGPGRGFPEYLRISNITRPTAPCAPPEHKELLWIFQATLAATQSTLASTDTLKKFLQIYNWSTQEGRRRRIEAIEEVCSEPMETVVLGSVIRGVRFIITLDEKAFADTGDLHIFGLVLSRFLSHYAAMNSVCELCCILKPSGQQMRWNHLEGLKCLL